MARQIVNGVAFGTLNNNKMYAETPEYNVSFKQFMNSIGGRWQSVAFKAASRMAWTFDAGYLSRAMQLASECFGEEEVAPVRQRNAKEEFAVAMGLGLIPQQDLND
jgi:hypothetical protein